MKPTDIVAKSDSCSNGEKNGACNGFVSIFQLMDLVAEKQNYLQMLQNNGSWGIEEKKEIGDERN